MAERQRARRRRLGRSMLRIAQIARYRISTSGRRRNEECSGLWGGRSMPANANVLRAAALLTLLAACGQSEEAATPEVRPVRVVTVEERAAGDTVSLTGTVQAQMEVNLAFRIDGRMTERLANVGDQVQPGLVIARLDPQNEENALRAARADLAAAQGQLG